MVHEELSETNAQLLQPVIDELLLELWGQLLIEL